MLPKWWSGPRPKACPRDLPLRPPHPLSTSAPAGGPRATRPHLSLSFCSLRRPQISNRHKFRLLHVLETVLGAMRSLEQSWQGAFTTLALENMTKSTVGPAPAPGLPGRRRHPQGCNLCPRSQFLTPAPRGGDPHCELRRAGCGASGLEWKRRASHRSRPGTGSGFPLATTSLPAHHLSTPRPCPSPRVPPAPRP